MSHRYYVVPENIIILPFPPRYVTIYGGPWDPGDVDNSSSDLNP